MLFSQYTLTVNELCLNHARLRMVIVMVGMMMRMMMMIAMEIALLMMMIIYSLLMLKLCEREQFFWDIWPLTCKWKTWAVSFISWVNLTLGVWASGRSMEVGHSVEVRHKFGSNLLQKHHFILKQTLDGSGITGPQSVVNFYLRLYFPSSYYVVEIKPKYVYQVLDAWPLNRGNNKQNSCWKVLKSPWILGEVLKKSLNSIFSWKVLKCLCKSLKSPCNEFSSTLNVVDWKVLWMLFGCPK